MSTTDLHSPAIEDYVKAIHLLAQVGDGRATTNAVAERLSVTPASASAMVKRLAERDLASHRPYRGVSLTGTGTRLALRVLRRHRLLETFLARELGMSWDRVHETADVLEHVISDDLEGLIAAKLGHPAFDPHGDPIPTVELQLDPLETVSLASLSSGDHATFVQVSDADPEILRYLGDRGITPGVALEVTERQPFGGPLSVRIGSAIHAFGGRLADAMRVSRTRGAASQLPQSKHNGDPR